MQRDDDDDDDIIVMLVQGEKSDETEPREVTRGRRHEFM